MDVLEKKYPEQQVRPYIEILKYKNENIQLLGTGSARSQLYPSDIDLFTKITTEETPDDAYSEFLDMIDEVKKRNDMYFVEFKIQQKDGEKVKMNNINDLQNEEFKFLKYFNDNIDYCKFDFVIYINGQFVELSSIYVFNKEPLDYNKLEESLSSDMMDLIKEGNYYKSLKRLFAIIKLQDNPNDSVLVSISRLFNSEVGKLYKRNSILKAIKLMQEAYPNDVSKDRTMELVFSNLGFKNIEDLESIIKDYDNLINSEGKNYINQYLPFLMKKKTFSIDELNDVEGGVKKSRSKYSNIVKGLRGGNNYNEFKPTQHRDVRSGGIQTNGQNLPSALEADLGSDYEGNGLYGGIFDGTEGMSPWEAMKYGFALPFKAVKEVNKVIPLSMIFGMGKEERKLRGGNLVGEFFNSAINPFYGIQKYRELTGQGSVDGVFIPKFQVWDKVIDEDRTNDNVFHFRGI